MQVDLTAEQVQALGGLLDIAVKATGIRHVEQVAEIIGALNRALEAHEAEQENG